MLKKIFSFIPMLKEFISDFSKESAYEIIDIFECPNTALTKAEIKLSGRHIIEKNINDIVTNINLLESFDKKTIRTLTYLATIESLKPHYSIIAQHLGNEVDDHLLEIYSRYGKEITKKSPSEISKDKNLLSRFSPIEANRIGYLAGMKETAKEFKMKPQD